MTAPTLALLGHSIRSWFSAKGFWLVAAAALLPLALTGAWVATHRGDIDVSEVTFDASQLVEGTQVEFTATVTNAGPTTLGPFNASLAVGTVSGGRLFAQADNEVRIETLAPGESRVVNLSWNATPGFAFVVVTADPSDVRTSDDEVGEVDEFNNQEAAPFIVKYAMPGEAEAPSAPADVAGASENATATSDLVVVGLTPASGSLGAQRDQTFTATIENRGAETVTNATVFLRLGRSFGESFLPQQETSENVTLAPGETTEVQLSWTTIEGAWWAQAYVQMPPDAFDPDGANNALAQPFTVDATLPADIEEPEVPEKLTIKEFYLQILVVLFLPILLPLISLFYASGTITEARDNNSLPYMLTRPLPRWLIPLTRFLAGFVVAGVAVVVGLALTYALLFGTGNPELGFLTAPILVALLALFAYGALFTLIGIWTERPYLIGALIIAWEFVIVAVPNIFQVSDGVRTQPLIDLAPWARNLSIFQHLLNAFAGWSPASGFRWIPDDAAAAGSLTAFYVVLLIGVGMLVAASTMMKRREFAV